MTDENDVLKEGIEALRLSSQEDLAKHVIDAIDQTLKFAASMLISLGDVSFDEARQAIASYFRDTLLNIPTEPIPKRDVVLAVSADAERAYQHFLPMTIEQLRKFRAQFRADMDASHNVATIVYSAGRIALIDAIFRARAKQAQEDPVSGSDIHDGGPS